MRWPWLNILSVLAAICAGALIVVQNRQGSATQVLLNVSYDPTRELYRDLNSRFVAAYEKEHGVSVAIRQSHGGSSVQAKLVARSELGADVVTLGLPSDVAAIQSHGLIANNWRERLPNHSRPYYSTIVFVVRKGNPRNIRDWPDLVKDDIEVITPDPKTSGNGKLTALAAWGSVVLRGGSEDEARGFLRGLYAHTPFLLTAARTAGVAFTVEKKGDVHVAWENEALREVDESKDGLEIVYPPTSILAEPSVAWVDTNTRQHGAEPLARAYLEFLFGDEAQEIIARAGYRPYDRAVLARHADRLPQIELFSISAIARDWGDAQNKFFGDNGVIDSVYKPKPRPESAG